MDRDEAGIGNHLDIVGATPTHPGIGYRNQCNPIRRSLLDRRLCRVTERQHPDIVAAVKGERDVGLAQHLHGSARQLEVFALQYVEDLGQA
jgi:hypothetical protein